MKNNETEDNRFDDPVILNDEVSKANRERLETFSEIIKNSPKATEEQRRKRISKFESLKRASKAILIFGMVMTFIYPASISRLAMFGGIGLMIFCQIGIKMNMTAQMAEEYEKEKMNKERKSYGIGIEESASIANDLLNIDKKSEDDEIRDGKNT